MGARTKIDWCDARRNKITTKQGYILIWKPGHPNSNKGKQKGYVFEHRLVMSEHLGRPLESGEVVHHINGMKVFMKESLRGLMGEDFRQEFPWEV